MEEIKFNCIVTSNDKKQTIKTFTEWLDGDGWKHDFYAPLVSNGVFDHQELGDGWFGEIIRRQYTGLKGFNGDIADVCIFLVSPENPDNDQHFRGVIEFKNGKFVFIIHKYLKFDGSKSEWINIRAKDLPFYEEELDKDGTYTVTYYDFLAMSSNLGDFCDDNVEIIGNVFENPGLLNGRHEA